VELLREESDSGGVVDRSGGGKGGGMEVLGGEKSIESRDGADEVEIIGGGKGGLEAMSDDVAMAKKVDSRGSDLTRSMVAPPEFGMDEFFEVEDVAGGLD
jgi:hypothetical protein